MNALEDLAWFSRSLASALVRRTYVKPSSPLSMPVRIYIATIAFVFMFLPPVAGLEMITCAWAAGDNSGVPETTVAQQGEQKPPDNTKASVPPATAPPSPEEQKPQPGFFDVLHSGLSRRVLSTAEWLDSFFLDERAVKEENHTYVRFRYDVFVEEKSGVRYGPTVDLRLVLPELQRKTHLVFSSEQPTPPPGAPAEPNTTGAGVGPAPERRATAAIHYFFRSTAEESAILRVGIVANLKSPALFVAPRYRLLIPLKPWDFRFSQEVVYRTDTRWQSETQFDLERPLPHELFFRTNVTGIWKEEVRGYSYSLNFSLRQPLTTSHALNYVWSNSYQTRPIQELTEVALRVGYRHSFWREWLFYEISPQVRFPRDRNFDVTPGILFRIEMFFGVTP